SLWDFFAEHAIEDLSHRTHRQVVADLHLLWNLIRCELRLTVSNQRLHLDRRPFFREDACAYDLAVVGVGNANHSRETDGWMHIENGLDLRWIHVEAVDDDHVLLALDDRAEAVFVHLGDVPRIEPAAPIGVDAHH